MVLPFVTARLDKADLKGALGREPSALCAFFADGADRTLPSAWLDLDAWASGADLLLFDRSVHAAEDLARAAGTSLLLRLNPRAARRESSLVVEQVMLRYQRLFPRVNGGSREPHFQRLLARFVALFPVEKPLVRADFDHAIDVWQWVLRISPEASAALQVAALFHDVERLRSEAEQRIEHQAPDYKAFKREHAEQGAQVLLAELRKLRLPKEVSLRAYDLVRRHEEPSDDLELCCLNDADALSFFTLNSEGYLAYFGAEQTAKKVAYTLARMGEAARGRLARVRLPPRVGAMIGEATKLSHHA